MQNQSYFQKSMTIIGTMVKNYAKTVIKFDKVFKKPCQNIFVTIAIDTVIFPFQIRCQCQFVTVFKLISVPISYFLVLVIPQPQSILFSFKFQRNQEEFFFPISILVVYWRRGLGILEQDARFIFFPIFWECPCFVVFFIIARSVMFSLGSLIGLVVVLIKVSLTLGTCSLL